MATLEELKFALEEKEKQLSLAELDIFVFNPDINKLINEIAYIKKQIQELESEEDKTDGE